MLREVLVLSINVGKPEVIGYQGDKPVVSAIAKKPITTVGVGVRFDGIIEDQQVDKTVHGGSEKAIYMFPSEHYAYWSQWLGRDLATPSFGENLSISGLLEHEVREGDIFTWGNQVQLEVVKYRQPCIKLDLLHDAKMIAEMRRNGLCGWYVRVTVQGDVGRNDKLQLVYSDRRKPTIAEMFRSKFPIE